MVTKYITCPIFWEREYEKEIAEVYRLFKDQERKIFDLSWHKANPDGLMDFIEDIIKEANVFVVKEGDVVAGAFILTEPKIYKDIAIHINTHCAVSKKYWGPASREVCKSFIDYLKNNFKINRLLASVPQCGYGIIKLLKNMGFRHEGTIKRALVYKDKYNEDKLYDKLIYALDLEEN